MMVDLKSSSVLGIGLFFPAKAMGLIFSGLLPFVSGLIGLELSFQGSDKTRWTPLTAQRTSELPPAKIPHAPR